MRLRKTSRGLRASMARAAYDAAVRDLSDPHCVSDVWEDAALGAEWRGHMVLRTEAAVLTSLRKWAESHGARIERKESK